MKVTFNRNPPAPPPIKNVVVEFTPEEFALLADMLGCITVNTTSASLSAALIFKGSVNQRTLLRNVVKSLYFKAAREGLKPTNLD